jgi:hypothetical protein
VITLVWSKKWAAVAGMAGVFAAVAILAGTVGGVLYGAGAASAQEPEPTPCPPCGDRSSQWFSWGCRSWTEFDVAADAVGLTPDELFAELHDGWKTLAEVAEEQGVDMRAVENALNANLSESTRGATEEGRLSRLEFE